MKRKILFSRTLFIINLFYFYFLAHCYEKVRKETEQIQEKIQEKLGLNPVEQEVIILYEGEKGEQVFKFLFFLRQ